MQTPPSTSQAQYPSSPSDCDSPASIAETAEDVKWRLTSTSSRNVVVGDRFWRLRKKNLEGYKTSRWTYESLFFGFPKLGSNRIPSSWVTKKLIRDSDARQRKVRASTKSPIREVKWRRLCAGEWYRLIPGQRRRTTWTMPGTHRPCHQQEKVPEVPRTRGAPWGWRSEEDTHEVSRRRESEAESGRRQGSGTKDGHPERQHGWASGNWCRVKCFSLVNQINVRLTTIYVLKVIPFSFSIRLERVSFAIWRLTHKNPRFEDNQITQVSRTWLIQ